MVLSRQKGFTLIELLVVMFLIGLMSSAAVISLRTTTPEDDKANWGQQFQSYFRFVSDMGVLSQKSFGLQFSQGDIRFLAYKEGEWEAVAIKPVKNIDLPENADLTLYVNHRLVTLQENDDEKPKPHVLIDASGSSTTPFELQVQSSSVKHVFKGSAIGDLNYEASAL